MRNILTACILLFSLSLAARDNHHLPEIVNYYQHMNFLERNKKDTIDPVMAAIERLEIMSKKSIFSRSIYKMVLANMNQYMPMPVHQTDSTAILLNQMLDNIVQTYTAQSTQYAQGILWCAHICTNKGDNKQGKKLLNKSKKLLAQYSTGSFDGRDTLLEIFYQDVASQIEYNSGRNYRAILISEKVCRLKKDFFGENSEVYFNALLDLSNLYAERKQYAKANMYHNLGYNAYVERIKTEFCSTSESERAMFWEKAKTYIYKTISIAHKMPNTAHIGGEQSLAAAAYNALLLSKGLLLNTSNSFENYIYNSGNEEALSLLRRKKILITQSTPQQVLDSLDYAILDALKRNNQTFELPHLSIHWQDVVAKLEKNDLVIEFYRTENEQYGAILLKKEWNSPRIIKLKKKDWESLHLERYKKSDANKTWRIAQSIWPDDIVKHFPVNGEGQIYFAADGILQITGIEYLPYCPPEKDGTFYCLSDLFHMYRLSSSRELVLQIDSTHYSKAVLYGGIQYNVDANELITESEKYPKVLNRSMDIDATDRGKIAYLNGTKKEVEDIMVLLKDNQMDVHPYTSVMANEESFKALSGQHQDILHIATHGFFWTDSVAQNKEYFSQQLSESDKERLTVRTIDPLNRCGLLFAGAQLAWSGRGSELPAGVQDGILTAKEISLLDLRDADLVVLSACETGKGEVTGDGVFGLQRAFKMAGAQTIVMSLWPVNDAATQLLMTEFYRNWITLKQPKRTAFRNAQNTVRAQFDEPVYWAGFVMLD